ncbi:hypothetical protein IVB18_49425 (plasmid) [Bradyrhizobium sp. 186]|uniref:hypothetical protein n=1 Tax=Bradyrhizobium sp. 186 TaxID=2782654 RepID=UPI002001BAFD|nr:hypothetical protein [Bradyrhizobium sp. 186]UPK41075.1 hypothetical protein IVB18_49425 [Bradyrhizobium sp. 186]
MAEVTYYVALPFVAADDGIAAGEPTECFNPNAAVLRAEAQKNDILRHILEDFAKPALDLRPSRVGNPGSPLIDDRSLVRAFFLDGHLGVYEQKAGGVPVIV